ncbi:MAG: hypothetical protein AAGF09_02055 [Pseudomonadota bacterium]
MRDNSLFVTLTSVIFVLAGLAMIGSNLGVARDGMRLAGGGEEVLAQIVAKDIERPARKTGVRGESVSVNGTRVRALSTYFNSYFVTVSYAGPEGSSTSRAAVSYEAWHALDVGAELPVITVPAVAEFVDASGSATLLYSLKQIGIGLAIIMLGLAVLFLPSQQEDRPRRSFT